MSDLLKIEDYLGRSNWGRYLTEDGSNVIHDYEGWSGLPVEEGSYSRKGAQIKVYVLNPDDGLIADWIRQTISVMNPKYPMHVAQNIAIYIKYSSGGQFPIRGLVYEEYLNGFLPFLNGVTTYFDEIPVKIVGRPTVGQINHS